MSGCPTRRDLACDRAFGSVVAALALALCACSSERHWEGHVSGRTWGDAFAAQGGDAWQWGSEAALLVALPVAFAYDDELRDAALEHDAFSDGDEHVEDVMANVMAATPLLIGLAEWPAGDDARALEVAGESLALSLLTVEALKDLTGRERPDGSNDLSFPSGHTTKAFVGATFIGRWVDARWDSNLGYLAWLPASAVGLARMQHDRHWASDVVAGALLGSFFTNLIWNAHYGPGEHSIYRSSPKAAWSLAPVPMENGFALSLTLSL
jgi:hypothetical protein